MTKIDVRHKTDLDPEFVIAVLTMFDGDSEEELSLTRNGSIIWIVLQSRWKVLQNDYVELGGRNRRVLSSTTVFLSCRMNLFLDL